MIAPSSYPLRKYMPSVPFPMGVSHYDGEGHFAEATIEESVAVHEQQLGEVKNIPIFFTIASPVHPNLSNAPVNGCPPPSLWYFCPQFLPKSGITCSNPEGISSSMSNDYPTIWMTLTVNVMLVKTVASILPWVGYFWTGACVGSMKAIASGIGLHQHSSISPREFFRRCWL